ncbi:MAG: L-seryl-tRNA(Sec) selenium transferase [Anaerolineae bacterium]
MQAELRKLPGVDKLMQETRIAALAQEHGRDLSLQLVREVLEDVRQNVLAGQSYPGDDALVALVGERLALATEATLRPVINASGVILQTNLGRAPLSEETLAAMRRIGEGYSNLEYELAEGSRGSRYVHAESLLCRLTGAEAALVVNNNAGAVLLVLSALAQGREVVISRGQLVEIGGGFRIPDVMAQSGATLVEVGTTNRTYARDYADAINERTAALMRVHTSNFRVIGFTYQAQLDELVQVARAKGLRVIDDLGSGTLLDTTTLGLPHEPTVQESVAAGADVVTFSGDKLLGGPQAGIIVGKAELVERLRRAPLTRALRVDKTTLAGIQANLLHYARGEALEKIPVWRMMSMPVDEVEHRARALVDGLGAFGAGCTLRGGRSMIGGGSLPEESLPTVLVGLPAGTPHEVVVALRTGNPAVVARVQEGHILLDMRTVLPVQEDALLARLRQLL